MTTRQNAGAAWLILLSCLSAGAQEAQQPDPSQAADAAIAAEVYKPPKPIQMKPAMYPEIEIETGREGWVVVHFMIDLKGKPYEIAVVESTGIKAFELAAAKAVEKFTFEPATIGDRPVTVSYTYKTVFRLRGQAKAARPQFVRAYKHLIKAIAEGDRERADAEFRKLDVQNLYEDAYNSVANFQYYRTWGTEIQQAEALRRALARERTPRYLEKSMFIAVLHSLLELELKLQDFAGARDTWEMLRENAPEESERWAKAMQQVEALRTDDRPYGVPGRIGKDGSWFYRLLKNRFQVALSSGLVSALKLRCDTRYFFFDHERDMQYKIEGNHGSCVLEVIGAEGTKFDLIQS